MALAVEVAREEAVLRVADGHPVGIVLRRSIHLATCGRQVDVFRQDEVLALEVEVVAGAVVAVVFRSHFLQVFHGRDTPRIFLRARTA